MALQGVTRVLDVLEAVADLGPASLAEIATAAGLPKSGAHRMLQSLVERGYVVQDDATRAYRLGLGALRLATSSLDHVELRPAARPHLERLAQATGETVHLVTIETGGVVYLDKVDSAKAVRMASRVGMRGDLHSTACGKAVLAHLPADEVDAVVASHGLAAHTERTITDPAHLRAELRTIRSRGWALDDQENEPDVRCVAMPVIDAEGRPVAAVSVSAPAYRLPLARVRDLLGHLDDAVRAITESAVPAASKEHPWSTRGRSRSTN